MELLFVCDASFTEITNTAETEIWREARLEIQLVFWDIVENFSTIWFAYACQAEESYWKKERKALDCLPNQMAKQEKEIKRKGEWKRDIRNGRKA